MFGAIRGYWGRGCSPVQVLGNIRILKSYLLLVWSEWDWVYHSGFAEMCTSIREDFSGVGMGCHREDLIKWLDHILEQLDQGLEYLQWHKSSINENDIRLKKWQYKELKRVLLEVDKKAVNVLLHTSPG